jgi:NTE family protein
MARNETQSALTKTKAKIPKYEHVVLALQGGGALGAYQAGVYQGLSEAGLAPDWVVGVSIGAVNAALIAGNPPERRVARLREFWERMSSGTPVSSPAALEPFQPFFARMHVASAIAFGVPGFFVPRVPPPFMAQAGSLEALSFYDTEPLNKTLAELVDFNLIKQQAVRLSLGAVNVRNAESVYFDNVRTEIRPDHVRASGALPPGFPPVEIDGELFWDGGIASNSPLWYVADESAHTDVLIIQADVFNPRGEIPQTMEQANERVKDIQYASKQRLSWDRIREREELRASLRRVLEKIPNEHRNDADVQRLTAVSDPHSVAWVRLVNDGSARASSYKDVDFSHRTVTELWNDGLNDVRRTIRHESWRAAIELAPGFHFFEATAARL